MGCQCAKQPNLGDMNLDAISPAKIPADVPHANPEGRINHEMVFLF